MTQRDALDRELIEAAQTARERAYAPYSGFAVGAAIRDARGRIHTGVNVENASLGLSICAERNAVFHAVAEGAGDFASIAIVAEGQDPTPPCGACRQVLMEFAPRLRVILADTSGHVVEYGLDELLAHPFVDFRSKGAAP
jgi:cytidine deaminase